MTWHYRSAVPTTKVWHMAKTGMTALKVMARSAPRAKQAKPIKRAPMAKRSGF